MAVETPNRKRTFPLRRCLVAVPPGRMIIGYTQQFFPASSVACRGVGQFDFVAASLPRQVAAGLLTSFCENKQVRRFFEWAIEN